MICTASRHRPVSKKIKIPAIFRFLPFPSPAPSTRTSSATLPATPKNLRSKTSLQKFRPLHVWLPAQAFSCTVPSSSPKTIKWSSLLSQFSGAAIRLPTPWAAIRLPTPWTAMRLPVRPPSGRSHTHLPYPNSCNLLSPFQRCRNQNNKNNHKFVQCMERIT